MYSERSDEYNNMPKKRPKIKLILTLIIILFLFVSILSYFIYVFIIDDNFLLVETERRWSTELISGNYTDGHMCFDFPMYSIDENNRKIDDWGNKRQTNYKLVFGSASFGGGLKDSGGASGLDYIKEFPFYEEERVPIGESYFMINITITENLKVFINDSLEIKQGKSKIYSYDFIAEYTNKGYNNELENQSNQTCMIRYRGSTTVKNYGFWKKSDIKFRDNFFLNILIWNDSSLIKFSSKKDI